MTLRLDGLPWSTWPGPGREAPGKVLKLQGKRSPYAEVQPWHRKPPPSQGWMLVELRTRAVASDMEAFESSRTQDALIDLYVLLVGCQPAGVGRLLP